jgi:hypothetical protein
LTTSLLDHYSALSEKGADMSQSKYENPKAKKLDFKNGVLLMPLETFRHPMWIALTSSAKVVYMAMLTEFKRDSGKKNGTQNPDNEVKITQETIEKLTGLSHPTVGSAIAELRGYRRCKGRKETDKSSNRIWEFEKFRKDADCFVFLRKPGGLEKNVAKYALNGKYLNTGQQE